MSGVIVIAFIMGIVLTIVGSNFCALYTHERTLRQSEISYLTERRDATLRRMGQLRTYASYCEQEAKCWPEDSIDHAELTTYAAVALRLADESQREWREIERKLRACHFEQITKRD